MWICLLDKPEAVCCHVNTGLIVDYLFLNFRKYHENR